MNEKSTVEILQRTQHDLMNHLQVIQGYLLMDKVDVVKERLAKCIEYYEQERKLIKTNAAKFILWMIRFNHTHDHILLNYRLSDDKLDLSHIEQQLLSDCDFVIGMIDKFGLKTELYEVKLELKKVSESTLKLLFTINKQANWLEFADFKEHNQSKYVRRSGEDLVYEFSYMLDEKR